MSEHNPDDAACIVCMCVVHGCAMCLVGKVLVAQRFATAAARRQGRQFTPDPFPVLPVVE